MELYPRQFVHSTTPAKSLRFMQWNILADGLSGLDPKKGGFVLSPDECLEWDYRLQGIVQEIRRWDPDIFVCQELDHFDQLLDILSDTYNGQFAPKTNSACFEISGLQDGVAIFIRKSKLKFKREPTIIKFEGYTQVALIATVSMVEGDDYHIVTTHLRSTKSAEGETIRQIQADFLLKSLMNDFGENDKVIFGADLNAFHLPKNGYEPLAYNVFTQNEDLPFHSAYQMVLGDEPGFTTWKERIAGKPIHHTIDYVFFRNCTPVNVLEMPNIEGESIATPNYRYPSDHFSLVIDFA